MNQNEALEEKKHKTKICFTLFFRLDNSSARVKAYFSHVANGWLMQTDRFDVKIKAGKAVVKLYDLSNGRRILGDLNYIEI